MNADEIVRTLKWLAKDTEFVFAGEALDAAADLIESLQAQLAAKDAEIANCGVRTFTSGGSGTTAIAIGCGG